jgi:UDP-N-acetyl-D-glucosamine dehydrogenase
VIDKVNDALNDDSKSVRGSKIVVLGVAYKRDIDDVRESPALDIISLLEKRGAHVSYHDPYVAQIRLEDEAVMKSTPYSDALLENADCVVIVTDHSSFDWQHVLEHSPLIVDTRHATTAQHGRARVIGL